MKNFVMGNQLKVSPNLVLLLTSVITTLSWNTLPSSAATLTSSADTSFNIFNLSPSAESLVSSVDANVFVSNSSQSLSDQQSFGQVEDKTIDISDQAGSVVAEANFSNTALDSFFSNSTSNTAICLKPTCFGLSETDSSILGEFLVTASPDSPASFGFSWNIESLLEASETTNPSQVSTAIGDASLQVCFENSQGQSCDSLMSTEQILSLDGTTDISTVFDTTGEAISVDFLNRFQEFDPDSNLWFVETLALGQYQQTFTESTQVRILQSQNTQAVVKAPEPSSTIALLSLSAIGAALVAKKKVK